MQLQTWYNLSDMGVEGMVNNTLSANAFCSLRVEDMVPDHSTLSRFRSLIEWWADDYLYEHNAFSVEAHRTHKEEQATSKKPFKEITYLPSNYSAITPVYKNFCHDL